MIVDNSDLLEVGTLPSSTTNIGVVAQGTFGGWRCHFVGARDNAWEPVCKKGGVLMAPVHRRLHVEPVILDPLVRMSSTVFQRHGLRPLRIPPKKRVVGFRCCPSSDL
jgi:hypothetical protein